MNVTDLGRMRFAYSPLIDIAESLWTLSAGRVQPVHRRWYDITAARLRQVDMSLLEAVVPAQPRIADFFFTGIVDRATPIATQLDQIGELAPERIADDLRTTWGGRPLPPAAQGLIDAGDDAPRRLAEVLGAYWDAALAPHWSDVRAVLDDDVGFRARELTRDGFGAVLPGLHHRLRFDTDTLSIDATGGGAEALSGSGLVLVPSVFCWPYLLFNTSADGAAHLVYPARGIGNLWSGSEPAERDGDTLGALLGRSRATILGCLALPQSTTDLAVSLGQSPSAVSQHLSILRRSGLVTSWRSGRRVLYQRTGLAASLIEASGQSEPGSASA